MPAGMESAVVPNNSDPSRLIIELVLGERIEVVDVAYYFDGHFAGKTALTLTGRREEIAVSEKGENLGDAPNKVRAAEEVRGQGGWVGRRVLLGAAIALPGAGSCALARGRRSRRRYNSWHNRSERNEL